MLVIVPVVTVYFDLQSKSRGSSSESKRLSKLPPRLAKQREQKEREKKENKAQASPVDTFIKIENWDNELANNIPTVASVPEPPPPKPASKSSI